MDTLLVIFLLVMFHKITLGVIKDLTIITINLTEIAVGWIEIGGREALLRTLKLEAKLSHLLNKKLGE